MKLQFDTDSNHEILVFINNIEIKARWVEDNQYFYQVSDSEAVGNLEVLRLSKGSKVSSIKTYFIPKFFKGYKMAFPFNVKVVCWQGSNNYGHYNRVISRVSNNSFFHGKFFFTSTTNCLGVDESVLMMKIIKSRGVELTNSKNTFGHAGKQINRRFVGEMLFMLFTRLFMLCYLVFSLVYHLKHPHEVSHIRMPAGLDAVYLVDIPSLLIHTYNTIYFIICIIKERKKNFDL